MTDVNKVVDNYVACWNEPDPEPRRELVQRTFADDATYVDAHRSGAGTDAIADMIGAAQQQFPDHKIELARGPEDAHNDRLRFTWKLVGPDGALREAGRDVGVLDRATAEPHDPDRSERRPERRVGLPSLAGSPPAGRAPPNAGGFAPSGWPAARRRDAHGSERSALGRRGGAGCLARSDRAGPG